MAIADRTNCEHIMAMKPILPADDKLREMGGEPDLAHPDEADGENHAAAPSMTRSCAGYSRGANAEELTYGADMA